MSVHCLCCVILTSDTPRVRYNRNEGVTKRQFRHEHSTNTAVDKLILDPELVLSSPVHSFVHVAIIMSCNQYFIFNHPAVLGHTDELSDSLDWTETEMNQSWVTSIIPNNEINQTLGQLNNIGSDIYDV